MQRLWKVLACLLVLGLVGAGTAGAAKLITGKQVKNGSLTGADIKAGSLGTDRLSPGARASLKGDAGPAGAVGPQGPAGADGADGGPHRYAEVSAGGLLQEDVRNIDQTQVSHPAAGQYCFTFPAGDRPTSGAANGTGSDTVATLQISPGGAIPGCPAGANVGVRTYDVSLAAYQDNEFRLILSSN